MNPVEDGGQRTEDGGQKLEVGGQRSETGKLVGSNMRGNPIDPTNPKNQKDGGVYNMDIELAHSIPE